MKIGAYEVVRELTTGGMAHVRLCRAPDGRLVVLKTPIDDDAKVWARLRDEARVGKHVAHHGLVETIELFEHGGRPVLVVAYVNGSSIHELRRAAKLDAACVARIGWQIASSLHTLHEACDETGRRFNVIHRDVSGGNIVVDADGDARLIDLGIAKFDAERSASTGIGVVLGTLRYMAPEVLMNGRYSPASDLWALGVTLVEAATGKSAFHGATGDALVKEICDYGGIAALEVIGVEPALLEILDAILKPAFDDRLGALPLVRRFTELERTAPGGDARAQLAERVREVMALNESAAAARAAGVVDNDAQTLPSSPPSLSESVVPTTPDTPRRSIAGGSRADLASGELTEPEPISPAKIKSSSESSANLLGLRDETTKSSKSRRRRSSSVQVRDEGASKTYLIGAGIGIAMVAVFVVVMLATRGCV